MPHLSDEIWDGKLYDRLKEILIRGLINSNDETQQKAIDDLAKFSEEDCRIRRAYVGDNYIMVDASMGGMGFETYWVCRVPRRYIRESKKGKLVNFACLKVYCL